MFRNNNQNQNNDGQEQQPPRAKAYKFVCIANCVFNGKYRRPGDVIVLGEKKEVPHFKLAEDEK